jgi:hypothetical protein
MKKCVFFASILFSLIASSQEHFNGMSTSTKVGMLNASINPAELPNLSKKFDVNFYGFSFVASNNKIGFDDIVNGDNLEELVFQGDESVNARINAEILGPGFAMRWKKWGFGFTTKAYAQFDIVDVNTSLGDAILNDNNLASITNLTTIGNQRLSGASYGEIGFSVGRTLVDNKRHKFNAGITLKLLFPGSYSNFGTSGFSGRLTDTGAGQVFLNNASGTINIAYSGNLAESFTDFSDYSNSIFGGLNGQAFDIGVNYQLKKKGKDKYLLNFGASVRNIGSMKFTNNNNRSTTYTLNVPNDLTGINLNDFQNADSLRDVEQILLSYGDAIFTKQNSTQDFKINLPSTVSLYADLRIVSKLFISTFYQTNLNKNEENDQISVPSVLTITPRITVGIFEAFLPVSSHEISGTNVGLGFRLGGFYLGTSSLVSAVITDNTKQADFYTGYRLMFL